MGADDALPRRVARVLAPGMPPSQSRVVQIERPIDEHDQRQPRVWLSSGLLRRSLWHGAPANTSS